MKIISTLLVLLPFYLFSPLMAQDDCALRLLDAQEKYSIGQIEKIPELLVECLKSGFTREEKIAAYKILISAYIFDDNHATAEIHMMEFLSKFPDYNPSAADPSVFINLMDEYDNNPRYHFGIKGGLNISSARVLNYHGVHNLNAISGVYSTGGAGFQTGFIVSKVIANIFEAAIEPGFMQRKFEYNLKPFPFAQVNYNETQDIVLLPITFTYKYSVKKSEAYLKTGLCPIFLLSGKTSAIRSYTETGNSLFNEIESPEFDIIHKRKSMNSSLLLGGGFRVKIPSGFFFLEASYLRSLFNEAKRNGSPANDDLSLIYFYVDDDFALDNIALSFGFCYSFHNPKKLIK
jgi:hypothetical protein